ncbi:MAG: hypothetical protein AAF234_13550 [Pseudomonadota bacterium]
MSDYSSILASVELIDPEIKAKAIKELPRFEARTDWVKTVSKNIYVYEWDRIFNRNYRRFQKWALSIFFGFGLLYGADYILHFLFGFDLAYVVGYTFFISIPIFIWLGSLVHNLNERRFLIDRLEKYKGTRPDTENHQPDVAAPQAPPPPSSPFDVPPQQ